MLAQSRKETQNVATNLAKSPATPRISFADKTLSSTKQVNGSRENDAGSMSTNTTFTNSRETSQVLCRKSKKKHATRLSSFARHMGNLTKAALSFKTKSENLTEAPSSSVADHENLAKAPPSTATNPGRLVKTPSSIGATSGNLAKTPSASARDHAYLAKTESSSVVLTMAVLSS